jgi:HD superfamily phosphohydrolase YqeK
MLKAFPHVVAPDFSKEIMAEIRDLLLSNNKPRVYDHVKEVADMNARIAEQYRLDAKICELCGYLHDVSAVISPVDMLLYAIEKGWRIDEAERKYPFMLHQRISKIIAEQDFCITDERVLSAIECHTTLKTNPSFYDMALFVADKLAWDQEGEAPFYSIVSEALEQSFEAASLAYMDFIVENKMILHPHKWFEAGMRYLRRVLN